MDSGSLFDKIIAVVIALILWVYVVNVINPPSSTTIADVPVQLLNQEVLATSGLAIAGIDQYTVDVVIEGARSDVLLVEADDITATADLFGLGKGQNYLLVNVNVPEKITVREVKSGRIPVLIDELVKVSKPVELNVSYDGEGYEVGGVILSPSSVSVIGAKSLVDQVPYVQIKLSQKQLKEESSTLQCSTEAVDEEGNIVKGVRISSSYVDVTASLYETKIVPLEVPVEGVLPEGIELKSRHLPQSITIKGTKDLLESIQAVIAKPIQIGNLTEDTTLPVEPILPEGLEIAKESVDLTAVFRLSTMKEVSFEYNSEDIWIYNIPEGYHVVVLTAKITVVAKGEEAIIDVLQNTDLQPAIDAASLTAGESEADVSMRYAQQLVDVQILPGTIAVRVDALKDDDIENE
ncbi:MAG: hypothetical protein EOM59_09600 [Clostridia bacterium]|nr:hypothetical protein [Clostridia bacterium]